MDDDLRTFLEGRHVATLGTLNRDGSIHLTNVWYLLEGASVYVQTPDFSIKAKNVARTGTASIVVDARGAGPMRGATTSGTATLITEPAEVAPIRERIMRHYMTAEAIDDPAIGGRMRAGDNAIIQLSSTRWSAWNVTAMFHGRIKPGSFLPLSD
jgi:PPOX class probable F420-dependent enzyme